MTELLLSCASTLDQPATPTCGTDYGERVSTIVVGKTMLWTAVPTATQINTAWTSGSAAVYTNIVNGHRVFLSEQEIEVVYREWVEKRYRIEGRTRRVNAAIARATEKLDRYPVLYVWYITDKNYCFGGYECSANFSLRIIEGKGSIPYISFQFDFTDLGIDLSRYDVDYGSMPVDVDSDMIITEDGYYFETENGETIIEE